MGQPSWGDTVVVLPPELARPGVNWLTGEAVRPVERGASAVFTAAELFTTLPVATILL